MSIDSRTLDIRKHPGPYLAEVVGNYDPTYMGGLDVVLLKEDTPPPKINKSFAIPVKYLSPFYGSMSHRYEGNNSSDWNEVQKSYGMWMVPPDVGTKVLVVFVGGNLNQGYWIGCVQDEFQNHMVPGLAASENANITQEQFKKYGSSYLPVAEIHKSSQDLNFQRDPYSMKKAVHPFADRLLAQGLLVDNVRGVSSSSARRESPSNVFGISTPGPLDNSPNPRKVKMGYENNIDGIASRLGGSTFVMDDGDADGANELVRIRTRTGHQILLHNSHDLIYIANGRGTAWIELTSNGKIDIFAQDSVSIHTEKDFNFRAERDIHLEAGRNFNIRAIEGDLNLNVDEGNYNLIVNGVGKLKFNGSYNLSTAGTLKLESNLDFNINSKGNIYQTSKLDLNLVSGGSNFFTTDGNTNIFSNLEHIETASKIFMNGPTAGKGASATGPAGSEEIPEKLPTFTLPNISVSSGWSNGNFYKSQESLNSIMLRAPTHEPWPDHENINPTINSSVSTDAAIAPTSRSLSAATISTVSVGGKPQYYFRVPLNPNQPTDWREDKNFLDKAKAVAKELKVSYEDFISIMYFETAGTMNPNTVNGKTGSATGLIQFLPSTARGLGTTTEYLAGLTRTEQLDWVAKYFNQQSKFKAIKTPGLRELYLAVFNPANVDKPDDYILYRAGQKGYDDNPAFDRGEPKKGYITVGMLLPAVLRVSPTVKQILAQIDTSIG